MKKILLVLAIGFCSMASFAQDTTKVELMPYVATGISIPNTTDFSADSYMSAEVGVMVENFTAAAVFGVNNLESFGGGINGYWYEGKVAYSFPLGHVDGYAVMGLGSYIGTKGSIFIEYGGGIMKSFGNFGYYTQVSSWDGIVYSTTGISYSL